MNVVLFTGGSGNANLIRHIKDLSYVNLSLLINGYDDGLSTGTIRNANQGMLGPSDFRKNFSYILDDFSRSNLNVKEIFEYRINRSQSQLLIDEPLSLFHNLVADQEIEPKTEAFITTHYLTGARRLLNYSRDLDLLTDFSIGNMIIGGLYETYKDFNVALKVLTDFFDLDARMINITENDDCRLVAFDQNGDFLSNEADIVNYDGGTPLRSFELLPFEAYSKLKSDFTYSEEEIRRVSHIPQLSNDAENAILEADLLLFGTGTLFSSLLPSYRICKSSILANNSSKKVLIINNEFDNDINKITLEEYIGIIVREICDDPDTLFFDHILADPTSVIKAKAADTENLVTRSPISNSNRKHNGFRLWKAITHSLSEQNGITEVSISLRGKGQVAIRDIYKREIENYNQNTESTIRFSLENNQSRTPDYHLILETSGKVSLYDIESWVRIAIHLNFYCVVGSRFYSRRQMILSFKKRIVESRFIYFTSFWISSVVSFIYFFRFFHFLPDPFSGIYLIKNREGFSYQGVSAFLKYVNKNRIEILSLPITYRTFRNVRYLEKSRTLLHNVIKLFI